MNNFLEDTPKGIKVLDNNNKVNSPLLKIIVTKINMIYLRFVKVLIRSRFKAGQTLWFDHVYGKVSLGLTYRLF